MRRFIIFLSISLLSLTGCGPNVYFDAPQPVHKKELKSFPGKLRGHYMNLDDSTLFVVNQSMILQLYDEEFAIPLDEIETSDDYMLLDDSLFIGDSGIQVKVSVRDDSVYGIAAFRDTIFLISDEYVLKKYKKRIFLNFREEKDNIYLWLVMKITFYPDGKAKLCVVSDEDEMDMLKEITTVEEIKSKAEKIDYYLIKPTKQEFIEYLKQDGFTDCTQYLKITR